ncbi:MAG: hypothetical protein NTX31_11165 [Burkholderiales bacterium]|nr:hypothetical protein [Burkholderiales bacterium]
MKTGSLAHDAGFAYYGLLLSVAAAALAAAAGSHLLGNELRREKEAELLSCGDEIRRAIESYHGKNNAGSNPFPTRLEWLLRDPHQATIQRYLRRICPDPMQQRDPNDSAITGGWALILDAKGQIVGVHSESLREPIKSSGFAPLYENFREARHYADWRFIAAGGMPAQANASTPTGSLNFIPSQSPALPLTAAVTPAPAPVSAAPEIASPPPAPAPAAPVAEAAPPAPPPAQATAPAAEPAPQGPVPAAQPAPPVPPKQEAVAAPAADRPAGGVQPFVIRAPSGF